MKRINVHFEGSTIETLDKLASKCQEGEYWLRGCLNRADLIRYAVRKTFHIDIGYDGERLEEKLNKMAKEIKKGRKK